MGRTASADGRAAKAPSPRPRPAQQPPALYKRLGGYDAIAAVTDELLARLSMGPGFAADPFASGGIFAMRISRS